MFFVVIHCDVMMKDELCRGQSKIKIAIDAEPEIRTELVKNYKEQIKSGEYKIDPDEVASKMISDALEEDFA